MRVHYSDNKVVACRRFDNHNRHLRSHDRNLIPPHYLVDSQDRVSVKKEPKGSDWRRDTVDESQQLNIKETFSETVQDSDFVTPPRKKKPLEEDS